MNTTPQALRSFVLALALATATVALPALSQTVEHKLVVYTGDGAPGIASAAFSTIENASASPDGGIILQATINGPGVSGANNLGIWTAPSGLVPNRLVARKGASAPWGTVYQSFAYPRIGIGGKVAFVAGNGASGDASLLGIVGHPDSLGALVFNGMPAPQKAPRKFLVFNLQSVNSSGVAVADALLDDLSTRGIWYGVPGNVQKLVVADDAAPGLGSPGTTFLSAAISSINEHGTAAFHATLSGDPAFSESIWKGKPGALFPVLRSGSTLANGEIVKSLAAPTINDADVIAFLAGTTAVSNGIWTHSSTGFQRHLSVGQAAPASVGNRSFTSFKWLALNNIGQLAFEANLSGDPATAQTLWRRDTDGTLTLIAQAGMILPVRGGTAVLSQILIDRNFLADNGEVTFRARFGSGAGEATGVYRSRVIPPAAATKPPVVKLSGGAVVRTSTSRASLRGTSLAGSAAVTRVEVRLEKAKRFAKANGTSKWSARPKVPVGRSKVQVRARAADGRLSKVVTARVVRRK